MLSGGVFSEAMANGSNAAEAVGHDRLLTGCPIHYWLQAVRGVRHRIKAATTYPELSALKPTFR